VYVFRVIFMLCATIVLGFISSVLASKLAVKYISEITGFVLNET